MMRNSRPAAILAMILILGFIVPTLCFALTAGDLTENARNMSGACHGDPGQMPKPGHSCCYAPHQLPAAISVSPSPGMVHVVTTRVGTDSDYFSIDRDRTAGDANDSSPPTPAVLRI
jgi:hypothetical protein